jgi:signal transduction histidine kinase
MQPSSKEVIILTIVISTILLLLFTGAIIYYVFLYQRKRHRHYQEVLELREAFNETLLESKFEIQEQTLNHISKELHSNFSQLVSLININLSEILSQSNDSVKENIIETKSLAKQILSDLKSMSVSLNTDHIIQIGFARALENEADRIRKTKRYSVSFDKTGTEIDLKPEQQIILLRLCQEILNNTIKHSKATTIRINLTSHNSFLCIEIADNGIGFDSNQPSSLYQEKGSTGLLNMRKRAKLISAEFIISSSLGNGTTIIIKIPNQ